MTILNKTVALFSRNEKGELLPVEVVLEHVPDKPTVRVIPMTKAEYQAMQQKLKNTTDPALVDAELVAKHVVDPAFTLEEAKQLRLNYSNALVFALLSVSTGITQLAMGAAKPEETAQQVEGASEGFR